MWSGTPKLFFVAVLAINCILWSHSRYAHFGTRPSSLSSSYSKRANLTQPPAQICLPISLPPSEQCTHVKDVCDMDRTFLEIGYLEDYFCAESATRPFIFVGYAFWLVFLFSTLGISASDFFCPNLATIAQLLGLDENVAGVTFLAFGNGSPDMFATFSAMRSNSGGLAIGELLGAATFITSCVVGSMCIIKPFKVMRGPFLRDVGFFTVAVTLLLVVLWDSKLEAWESAGMVVLYAVYVLTVVVGSWWRSRRQRQKEYEALMRSEYADEEPYLDDQPYLDEPDLLSHSSNSLEPPFMRARAHSHPEPPRLGIQTDFPARPRTRSSSPSPSPPLNHMPSFSLIGALEFRRVVSSLQRDAASSTLSHFESPLTPYTYRRSRRGTTSGARTPLRTPMSFTERDPWDAALGVPLNERSPPPVISEPIEDVATSPLAMSIPAISHTPASPTASTDDDTDTESRTLVLRSHRERVVDTLGHILYILFPTLHGFWAKPLLGKIAAVLAAPAVLALTITLPVVVTSYEAAAAAHEKRSHHHAASASENRLVDFEEEGIERALIAEEEVEEEMHELGFNKWLMAVQCCLGPLFCALVLLDDVAHEGWLLLATSGAGFAAAILVMVFADTGRSPASQLTRCAMGFIVAVVWIMAIADEVVKVLQTFGFIFGLSDAIIGITIFAIGNSLADLVANMSVAVFAPIMGFSACFGGPMLNILLGVGISGSIIVRETGVPYPLHFSPTLVVTGVGLLAILLATLVYVPLNGYFLPRAWGVALLVAYTCIMVTNIVVEVKTLSS
ncbi:Sodium/calcium exchanger protein-domain-containing protein [Epithele typhae]|uniref:Sodium/calcium exchanger protein-domain-containing protein n=1 Tax=Epithele typhae TaxID=378194 RepID=UPI0020074F4B|nr:Sodium/calcium exchanger protein-domain-containing protein [Epithele typhae]KAH9945222.1 Sodium/calcium exchanger protein-domain-containing protein [Epithele typhae]